MYGTLLQYSASRVLAGMLAACRAAVAVRVSVSVEHHGSRSRRVCRERSPSDSQGKCGIVITLSTKMYEQSETLVLLYHRISSPEGPGASDGGIAHRQW